MNYKFSIIIPVYNKEAYISRSIQSVINQTYKNYEIIIINDGSTDKSLEICESFKKKYPCITIYNQKNCGLSIARNSGLDLAIGDYICFLDADDIFHSNYLAVAHEVLQEHNYDLFSCSLEFNQVSNNALETSYVFNNLDYLSFILTNYKYCNVNVINKIYKKEIAARVRFQPKILYEDIEFTIRCIMESNTIFHYDNPLVTVYSEPHSITRSPLIKKDYDNIYNWKKMKIRCAKNDILNYNFNNRIIHAYRTLIRKINLYGCQNKILIIRIKWNIILLLPNIIHSDLNAKQVLQTLASVVSFHFFHYFD